MMNIILLDIDDCVIPSISTHAGIIRDNIDMFKINLNRLQVICERFDLKIGIISSWCHKFWIDENGVAQGSSSIKADKKIIKLILQYLQKYIVSIRKSESKESYIKSFVANKDFKNIIVIEDTDFSANCNINNGSHYLKTYGFITNNHIYKIKNIIEGEK